MTTSLNASSLTLLLLFLLLILLLRLAGRWGRGRSPWKHGVLTFRPEQTNATKELSASSIDGQWMKHSLTKIISCSGGLYIYSGKSLGPTSMFKTVSKLLIQQPQVSIDNPTFLRATQSLYWYYIRYITYLYQLSHPSGPSLSSYGGTSSVSSGCSPSAQRIVRWDSPNPPRQEQFIARACHNHGSWLSQVSVKSCCYRDSFS